MPIDTTTPVILLGGASNGVTVARNLGRLGVPIIGVGSLDAPALRSKYCRRVIALAEGRTVREHWRHVLLSGQYPEIEGAIVFAFDDESLQFMDDHREALAARYRVEDYLPDLRRIFLDKLATLVLAHEVGVPTPKAWPIRSREEVYRLRDELTFPVMVKPLNTFDFYSDFGRKLFIVEDDFREVVEKVSLSLERGHEIMVVEMIPGADSLLSSYYTYRTPGGAHLFDYTKRIIRRWPIHRGGGTLHQSEWLPETADMGRRLFDRIGWHGNANVEFKRDMRDGRLKLIEVNARFTAGHRLVTASGAPIDVIIYCYLTGQPIPTFEHYSQSLRMWDPVRDFLAFRDLHRAGKLGLWGWARSILGHRFILPLFSLDDPWPSLSLLADQIRRKLSRSPARAGEGRAMAPGSSAAGQAGAFPPGRVVP